MAILEKKIIVQLSHWIKLLWEGYNSAITVCQINWFVLKLNNVVQRTLTEHFQWICLKKIAFSTQLNPHILWAGAQQNTTDHKVCRQAVPRLSINKNESKLYDQYAVNIIQFPDVDLDHETEWDHPLWVGSCTTYSLDVFPIPFATASLNTYRSAP